VCTTLAPLLEEDCLREAYRHTSQASAPGIDGVTTKRDAEHLEENRPDVPERLRSGRSQAAPVERVWIEKDAGGQRPLGTPAFEDKMVQRAVAMLLEAIYAQDVSDCSYGFRPGRSAHDALHELLERCMREGIGWIVMPMCGEPSTVSTGPVCKQSGANGSTMGESGASLGSGAALASWKTGCGITRRPASCKAASVHPCWPLYSSIMSWMPGANRTYGPG
jgi:hypothetical protein